MNPLIARSSQEVWCLLDTVSQLVGERPEIAELDVNPFMAAAVPGGSRAVDARIRLA